MVSASKAKRQAKKAEVGSKSSKSSSKVSSTATSTAASTVDDGDDLEVEIAANEVSKLTLQEDKFGLSDRVTTGVLSSLETSRDVKVYLENRATARIQVLTGLLDNFFVTDLPWQSTYSR